MKILKKDLMILQEKGGIVVYDISKIKKISKEINASYICSSKIYQFYVSEMDDHLFLLFVYCGNILKERHIGTPKELTSFISFVSCIEFGKLFENILKIKISDDNLVASI